jgi:hypothetical protein
VSVKDESTTTRKVKSWRSWKYKEHSPTPPNSWFIPLVLAKYENLTISGFIILVVGLGGNRRRSITKVILDVKTLVKVVEERAEGLEEVVEQMEILEIEKVAIIIVRG